METYYYLVILEGRHCRRRNGCESSGAFTQVACSWRQVPALMRLSQPRPTLLSQASGSRLPQTCSRNAAPWALLPYVSPRGVVAVVDRVPRDLVQFERSPHLYYCQHHGRAGCHYIFWTDFRCGPLVYTGSSPNVCGKQDGWRDRAISLRLIRTHCAINLKRVANRSLLDFLHTADLFIHTLFDELNVYDELHYTVCKKMYAWELS
jgi:hypothetical protein